MSRRLAPLAAAFVALLGGTLTLGGLLDSLVHDGWAHSFDSAIYVRSLWGVANDGWLNPLVDLHVMSIHSNVVLLALAPLTRWLTPAEVLIAAQALAFGATLALIAHAGAQLGLHRQLRPGASIALGIWLAAMAALTPMVTNPFLFDLRPDLLGVPLLTAGLLRARRLDRFDAVAVALMLLALPAREEHMMVVVGALGGDGLRLLLVGRDRGSWAGRLRALRIHAVGLTGALGWWAGYWFVVRPAIGDGSDAIANEVAGSFFASADAGRARYALEAVVVFAAALGGLALSGWRWLGASIPGLTLLLATQRMPELALNFHYVMFMTPGLLVAGVAGLDRVVQAAALRPAPARARVLGVGAAAISAIGAVAFLTSSALPGGGRYRADNFGPIGAGDPSSAAAQRDLAAMHALARSIPEADGAALPYGVVADVASREQVWSAESLLERSRAGHALPDGLLWLGVAGRDADSFGRWAVDTAGFRAVGAVGSRMVLLSRAPVPAQWQLLGATRGTCEAPAADWSAHGVRICEARWEHDGHVVVTIERTSALPIRLAVTPPERDEPFIEMRGLRGTIPASHAEPGWIVPLQSTSPIDAAAVDVVLATPAGITERLRLIPPSPPAH